MILITWNIRWCRGVDGRVDPQRVVREARALADFDILCLQEVADNFPHPRLARASDADQFAELARLLPGYTAIEGVAVDRAGDGGRAGAGGRPGDSGRRRRFGNMILSRLPVGEVYRHLLPYPSDSRVPGMPRVAVEAVIEARSGSLRIVTTHLEYYSARQRAAQVDALRTIYADGDAHARDFAVTIDDGGPFDNPPRPRATLIVGDFNFEPDSADYLRLLVPFDGGATPPLVDATPPLTDAWRARHPTAPHPTTFKLYEKLRPNEPELHCDFVFADPSALARIAAIDVNAVTQASDHQPIVVTIE
ncbi:MAG TPA: endonuclease/exonuclease/phosphatase family protein [Casimicrobiaceae bacterium]